MTLSRRAWIMGAAGSLMAPRLSRAAPIVVKVGDQGGQLRALMQASKALEGADYDVQWIEFAAAQPLLEAMRAEALDLGLAGDAPFSFAIAAGAGIKAILGLARDLPQGGDDRSGGLSIMAPNSSAITAVEDLRGRKVATTRGSIGHFIALTALRAHGIRFEEVDFSFLSPLDARSALSGGFIDAWAVWDPYVALLEVEGGCRPLFNGRQLANSYSFLCATDLAIARKRPALADFYGRFLASLEWQGTHQEEGAGILSGQTGFSLAVSRRVVSRSFRTPVPLGKAVEDGLATIASLYGEAKLLPRGSGDIAGALDGSFYRK